MNNDDKEFPIISNGIEFNKLASKVGKIGVASQVGGFANIKIQKPNLDNLIKGNEAELEYKKSVLNALQGIEKNTALLTEMTLLLQKSNDKQDELFQLIVEIMEIMKSKDKEDADNKFTTVMKKITMVTDSASTIQSLVGMATSVYNALPF